jgi:hypothetical protein
MKMEDDLNFLEKRDNLNFFENGSQPKKIMQPKTIKSKNNGCGTAPGNLFYSFMQNSVKICIILWFNFRNLPRVKHFTIVASLQSRAQSDVHLGLPCGALLIKIIIGIDL